MTPAERVIVDNLVAGTFDGDLTVTNLDVTNHLDTNFGIRHLGDTDTQVVFNTDRVRFRAGNVDAIDVATGTAGDATTTATTVTGSVNGLK